VALLGVQVWALGRLEPMRQMGMAFGAVPTPATTAPEKKRPAARPVGWVGPSWLVRGHGIGWARLYRAAALLRHNPSVLLGSGALLVFFFPVMLLSVAVKPEEFAQFRWWLWLLPLLVLLPTMPVLPAERQRLYLLGVNYRQQMLHRLWTFWASPGLLPSLLLLGLVAWLGPDRDLPLGMAAGCLGLAVVRAGWSWPAFSAWPRASLLVFLVLLVLALVLALWPERWQPALGLGELGKFLVFAVVAGVLGLAGMVAKLVRLDEARLRAEMTQG
jgi:hypothetical protein